MSPRLSSALRLLTRTLALLALCALQSACTLLNLREESTAMHTATVLVGVVQPSQPVTGPIRVLAWTLHEKGPATVSHHTSLHAPGGYELLVPAGKHVIFAFCDQNNNHRYDPGEQAAWTNPAAPIAVSGDGVVFGIDLVLGSTPPPSDLAHARLPATPFPDHSTQAGALIDLDAPVFSAAQGERGYWAPLSFYRELGGNIYFAEPYDPRRIPVLFIHGAAGSPQDWRYVLSRLDRSRYQAWFFYYPSGSSIESMSHLLFWKLINLYTQYGFSRVYLTAHSMGGLVARDFLSRHAGNLPVSFPLFVTFATPWGGDPWAETGVRHSPATVPSWFDMQPNGPFLQKLFSPPLPASTSYHLFFGHLGSPGLFRTNNDGAVTLESQLRSEAQHEARMTYGFNESHTSILRSPAVFDRYATILTASGENAPPPSPQGSIRLGLFDNDNRALSPAQPLLILDPLDGPPGRIILSRNSENTPLGPLPAGRYLSRVFAYGYATDPASREITVTAGQPVSADFQLRPQGVLRGIVSAEPPADRARFVGYHREPHATLRIHRITLTGPGVQRSLEPATQPSADPIAVYFAGQDLAEGPGFSFVGLPAGDYELRIEADGHAPYIAHHTVVPGRYEPTRAITLKRL
ncbi:MAG: hypothetical protein QM760_09845 [Nibricoccus sp.]